MSGRKGRSGGQNKLPLALHALRGTKPRGTWKPAPAVDIPALDPVPPESLSPAARELWTELVPILGALAPLTVADALPLGLLSEAAASMRHVSALKARGITPAVLRLERQTAQELRSCFAL